MEVLGSDLACFVAALCLQRSMGRLLCGMPRILLLLKLDCTRNILINFVIHCYGCLCSCLADVWSVKPLNWRTIQFIPVQHGFNRSRALSVPVRSVVSICMDFVEKKVCCSQARIVKNPDKKTVVVLIVLTTWLDKSALLHERCSTESSGISTFHSHKAISVFGEKEMPPIQ